MLETAHPLLRELKRLVALEMAGTEYPLHYRHHTGHHVVMWEIDTNDWWGQTAAQITDTVMGNAHNGPSFSCTWPPSARPRPSPASARACAPRATSW